MSNAARNKGHNAERYFAKLFREINPYVKTSREASRLYDSCKIDLWGIPILVQIKAGYKNGIPYSVILDEIEQELKKNFPMEAIEHSLPRVIIHKKDVQNKGRGLKRKDSETLVIMTWKDFFNKFYKKIYDTKN
jgi:hypothetical protein